MNEPTLDRFMSKVEAQPNGCWHWTGTITDDGYGQFYIDGSNRLAHRVAYEMFAGPIPADLQIDHLCHTREREKCSGGKADPHRRCVRFDHLEPVPGGINTLRGNSQWGINSRKTHCDSGHEFTPENTYIDNRGARQCVTCKQERSREWVRTHHPGVRHGTETHCPQGHPYEGDNLIITVTGGRACRECKRADARDYMRRKRAAEKARKAGASEAEIAEIMRKKPASEAA